MVDNDVDGGWDGSQGIEIGEGQPDAVAGVFLTHIDSQSFFRRQTPAEQESSAIEAQCNDQGRQKDEEQLRLRDRSNSAG